MNRTSRLARAVPAEGLTLRGALAPLVVLALTIAACNTQRFPGPMPSDRTPLPVGAVPPGPYGPQEIVVYRLSDPVLVRREGASTSFPLPVYNKRERVRSGASVQCAAGGRCELLWPQDASSILMFDEGWVDLGEPSRDEPLVTFRRVTRARMILTPEDRVVLMGGAELRGDPEEKSGPFLVERTRADLIRLTNQSKKPCSVAFRDEEILLSPGELLRLPLLEVGGEARPRDPAEVTLDVAGRAVRIVGDAKVEGTAIVAGPRGARIEDAGLVIRLAPGERAELDVYSAPDPGGSAPPKGADAPEAAGSADQPPADEAGAEETDAGEPAVEPAGDDGTPAPEDPAEDAPPPAAGDDPPAPPPSESGDGGDDGGPPHAFRASLPMWRGLSALPPQLPLAPDPS